MARVEDQLEDHFRTGAAQTDPIVAGLLGALTTLVVVAGVILVKKWTATPSSANKKVEVRPVVTSEDNV